MGIEGMEPEDPRQIGEELREAGVERVGGVGEAELGYLEAPELPDAFADAAPEAADGDGDAAAQGLGDDELYREADGDYLAAARDVGADATGGGVVHVGGLSEADLGSLAPPETPPPGPEETP